MSKDYLFQEILLKNPVLIGTIGLCPIVAICTSLKSALVMSVITILTLLVAQSLSSLIFTHLPQWLRMGLYMLVGMLVVVPCIAVLERFNSDTILAFGIYLPLLSVNPLIVRQCEREGVNIGFSESLINSLCAGAGYSVVLIIVGTLREILGNGTIWGVEVLPIAPAAAMAMPMGGFVIIAFLAAALRAYFKKIDPEYAEELAVNSRTAIRGTTGLKSLLIDMDDEEINPPLKFEIMKMETSEELVGEILEKTEKLVVDETENEVPTASADDSAVELPEESNNVMLQESRRAKSATRRSLFFKKKAKEKEFSQSPEKEEKPMSKYQFITIELPSAKRKAEEEKALEKAESERMQREAATEKEREFAKRIEQVMAAEEKAQELKREARAAAASEAFAAPLSEEEAMAETKVQPLKQNDKKTSSNIVYRSDELERLMSLSVEDIINGIDLSDSTEKESENK